MIDPLLNQKICPSGKIVLLVAHRPVKVVKEHPDSIHQTLRKHCEGVSFESNRK